MSEKVSNSPQTLTVRHPRRISRSLAATKPKRTQQVNHFSCSALLFGFKCYVMLSTNAHSGVQSRFSIKLTAKH